MSIPMIMGGLVVIEYIFAWPGLGQLSLKAILEHDFPVIQAYVLIVAVLFIVFNTLADIINALLNPRLREGTMIILKRLLQDKGAVIALGIIVLYVFLGLAAPLVTFYDPNHIDTANKFAGMSFQHLLGTDHLEIF